MIKLSKLLVAIFVIFLILIDLVSCRRRKRLSRVGIRPDPPLKPFINASDIYISYTEFLRGFINSQGLFNRNAPIPSNCTYAHFMNNVASITPLNNSKIKDKNELSAFMAHVLVASKGLTVSRENNTSIVDDLTRTYFRRGYLGIKGADEYRQVSLDLYNDFRLLDVPELILQDESVNWQISVWNWKRSITTRQLDFSSMAKSFVGGKACENVYKVYTILKKEWDPKSESFINCEKNRK